jgi:thiazolinyl imide reductase
VAVAGANYGRAYLSALAHARDRFETAGLLATGSIGSVRAAAEFGVAHYRSVKELPDGIELVCAAVGSRGFPVVLDLLRRRIPVLCEHPLSPSLLDAALKEAATNATRFHVNGHFAMLPCSREFSRRLSSVREHPAFLEILATERSLYAALDVLFQSVGQAAPFEIISARPGDPFESVEATLAGMPLLLRLQCTRENPIPDGDAAYLVDYRISAGFRSGLLSLLSMGGPVSWTANYACVQPATASDIKKQASPEELRVQRRDANLAAIEQTLNNSAPPEQQAEYLCAVSSAWHRVGEASVLAGK